MTNKLLKGWYTTNLMSEGPSVEEAVEPCHIQELHTKWNIRIIFSSYFSFPHYSPGFISTGFFFGGQQMSFSTLPMIWGAWATEGPPIKTPSGPGWQPDKHIPTMHHVGATRSRLLLPPVCHFAFQSPCILVALNHQSRQNKAFCDVCLVCADKPT